MNELRKPPVRRSFGWRLFRALVLVQFIWLVAINGALFLPLTQELINDIKPEKFQIRWERAWSWFPGQVSLRGAFANGQSRKQQWQARVDSVSARVSLIPLMFKRVSINWGSAENASYWQRPRLRPDRDYTLTLPWFPNIEGYEVLPVSDEPLPDRKAWKVVIGDVNVRGSHEVWIQNIRSTFDADVTGNLSVQARGGPLEMDIHSIAADVTSATINGDVPVVSRASLAGRFGFEPFNPRANKGLPMLRYVITDLELDVEAGSLAFLNLFLLKFKEMDVQGQGAVEGRLVYAGGKFQDGTQLHVDADDLAVRLAALTVSGAGDVDVTMDTEPTANAGGDGARAASVSAGDVIEDVQLAFDFDDLEVRHRDDPSPMLTGQGLELDLLGGRSLLPVEGETDLDRTVSFALAGLTVPDLSLLQRYVPEKWPFVLNGGQGQLYGGATLSPKTLSVDLRLASEAADLGLRQYRFTTNLDAALRLENPDTLNAVTRVDDTYLALRESRLQREDGTASEPWSTVVRFESGTFGLIPPEEKVGRDGSLDLLRLLANRELKQLIGESQAELDIDASVSSLAFLGLLMGSERPAAVEGSGAVAMRVLLDAGLPRPGTSVDIRSEDLGLRVLDYVARGEGRITLAVEKGGERPDWRLIVGLLDGRMRRRSEDIPGIENVNLELEALVRSVSFEARDRAFDIQLRMPPAHVPEMSIFNGYLPGTSTVAFTGGSASLEADVRLQHDDADGFVRLTGEDISANLGGQAVTGDLDTNVLLSGGSPGDMRFAIDGSTLSLDEVRVDGENQDFEDEAWSTNLTLTRGRATLVQPPRLELEAELTMSDTRPIVAVYRNNGGSGFVGKLLETQDLSGTARLTSENDVVRIPEAFLDSEDIEVGIKGIIDEGMEEGMIFLRWRAVHGLLKYENGRRNIDIFQTRRKYEEYVPP